MSRGSDAPGDPPGPKRVGEPVPPGAGETDPRAAAPTERRITEVLDLCLRTGELLLSNGAGAADVAVTMDSLARHFGLRNAEIDVTFISLSMGYAAPDGPSASLIRQVKRRTVDFDELTSTDHLVADILSDDLDLAEARRRVTRIGSTGRRRSRWAVNAGWAAMCAGVALVLGGNLVVVLTALLAGAAIEQGQHLLDRRRLPTFYQQVLGGFVAMVFAVAVSYAGLGADPSLVVSANIVMLLSGVGFMGALQDALTGYYLTSTARLLEVILSTAGIIAGVAAGLALARLIGAPVEQLSPSVDTPLSLVALVVGAALAAVGFGYASRARKGVLAPIGALGAGAVLVARLLDEVGVGRVFGVAAAAFLVGLVAYPVARRFRVPPLVVVISSVVALLPGLTIYRGLTLVGTGRTSAATGGIGPAQDVATGILNMVLAGSIALALAAGVILGEYVAQPLTSEVRRLERRFSGPRLVGPIRWQAVRRPRRGGSSPRP